MTLPARGDACMGASFVRRWVNHFKIGNTDIVYHRCSDCPRTACTERNTGKIDELIRENILVTVA
jgi:hypothetical protein